MKKPFFFLLSLFSFITAASMNSSIYANPSLANLNASSKQPNTPIVTPSAPTLNAKAYILIDVNSGKIIAEKNSEEKLPPASLTKMMSLYVISNALHHQQIQPSGNVRISRNAWQTGGSRMFVKENQEVSVENLVKGIIVDSGNDACVAMSEFLGGSENGFAELMNSQAKQLGMNDSNFTDSTGLPDDKLYSTAKDLAILGRALIQDFPEYYHWYKQKWFTFNGIRQANRNRLLWRDSQVDGLKTGHTDKAGYCLVASAKQDNMRLLAVVLGSPNETSRANDSERLLNYGFRFYETHELYKASTAITELPLYKGTVEKIAVGLNDNQFVTIPTGQYQHLNVTTSIPKFLQAPIEKGDKIGELVVRFDDKVIGTEPLYALQSAPQGGIFTRAKDSVKLTVKSWLGA